VTDYVVTYTSPVIEADTADEAISRADETSGGHWEAEEVTVYVAPTRPHHTPSELAEEAARAVVTARGFEHTQGEPYVAALGWALGGQVTYEQGLALFATAAADTVRAAAHPDSTALREAYDRWSEVFEDPHDRDYSDERERAVQLELADALRLYMTQVEPGAW